MSSYIEPSSEDLYQLERAQDCEAQLSKHFKNKRHADIFFYFGLVFLVVAFLDNVIGHVIGGFALFSVLLGGAFKYSYYRGEGKMKIEMYSKDLNTALSEVKCKWHLKDDKYYVYLEDGRKIEIDEY